MKCRDHVLSGRNLLMIGALAEIGISLTDFLTIRQTLADQSTMTAKKARRNPPALSSCQTHRPQDVVSRRQHERTSKTNMQRPAIHP